MIPKFLDTPTAVSSFAGIFGAGLFDAAWVCSRTGDGRVVEIFALALGLYGVAGLVAAVALGWAVETARRAVPGGLSAISADERLDNSIAATTIAGGVGAIGLGIAAAAIQGLFVGQMASRRLAVIATFGLVVLAVPAAVLVVLAFRDAAARVAHVLPRPTRMGRTGFVALTAVLLGCLAGLFALSRADWRVLDLGPLKAAGVAIALGAAHLRFWYLSQRGSARLSRLPIRAIRVGAVGLTLGCVLAGSRVPDSSPTFEALTDESWGMRAGLAVARKITDRDGDGFSRFFGGGDCDDRRAATFPGAEEIPGDGIDQNCEGGDAPLVARPAGRAAPSTSAAQGESLTPAAGAFDGNLLIVSVDALRADRLGVAGYGRPKGRSLTPTLDALANRGAYFRRAWSQAPNTPRSFPSFLTSRYPSRIAWQQRTANYSPILPENETFFEVLARGGWKPIGIFSHFYFTADRGLSQGFAEWSNDGAGTIAESNKDIPSPRIVPKMIERLERAAAANERIALWTHLFEPHSSYLEHPEFPVSTRGIAGLEEKYDYEIAFVDKWIGKLFEALERTGLARKTAVVIVADHGEAWGEHKRYFHGQDVTEEQLRVPLIVAIPGRAPTVIDDEVGLIDVGPTLLELVGLPVPETFTGRSLLGRIDGKPLPARPLFAELLPANAWPKHEVMMVLGKWKITHRVTERRWDLHDLSTDAFQQRNLAQDPAHRTTFEELRAKLLAFEEGRPTEW